VLVHQTTVWRGTFCILLRLTCALVAMPPEESLKLRIAVRKFSASCPTCHTIYLIVYKYEIVRVHQACVVAVGWVRGQACVVCGGVGMCARVYVFFVCACLCVRTCEGVYLYCVSDEGGKCRHAQKTSIQI
jgi:hypothetical protein